MMFMLRPKIYKSSFSSFPRMCLFLCEENNDFINGENITIDGGMTKKMIYIE